MRFRRTAHIGMTAEQKAARRGSLGGSDARIIMSGSQEEVEALWREKRGEDPDLDLTDLLLIHLGNVTENLNLDWFEDQTGFVVTDEQRKVVHPDWDKAHATLDGIVRNSIDEPALGVNESKFMFPFYWSMEAAIEKYYAQVQHNAACAALPYGWLSVITGGGQWKMAKIEADIFYQVRMLHVMQDFWDCVVTGRTPKSQVVAQPQRIVATRVVDMTSDADWGAIAAELRATIGAVKRHDKAKRKLKGAYFTDDMAKVSGNGVVIRRGKDGRALWTIDEQEPLAAAA